MRVRARSENGLVRVCNYMPVRRKRVRVERSGGLRSRAQSKPAERSGVSASSPCALALPGGLRSNFESQYTSFISSGSIYTPRNPRCMYSLHHIKRDMSLFRVHRPSRSTRMLQAPVEPRVSPRTLYCEVNAKSGWVDTLAIGNTSARVLIAKGGSIGIRHVGMDANAGQRRSASRSAKEGRKPQPRQDGAGVADVQMGTWLWKSF